jgi:transposase
MDGKQTCPECERLRQEVAVLKRQVEKLAAALEEAQRAGKRQAAPFRKGQAKKQPKRPGRKAGESHGQHVHRTPPKTDEIDETHDVPLPDNCPRCGSTELQETHVARQYQTDIPRRPIHRQFDVHVGQCTECGQHVRGRHPLQTSDAVGAAAAQLGPDAHSALAILNKQLGLSHGKCAKLFDSLFGIHIDRSTSVRSILRTARHCEGAYEEIRGAIRASPVVTPDETGWRIAGKNAWLHVFASKTATCYAIDESRGASVAEEILTADYAGVLVHDGWAPYDRFTKARHQQCLAHLLRRCREMIETATRGAVRFPRAVATVLKKALALRDRFATGTIGQHGLAVARGRLAAALERLVFPNKVNAANERLAAFLWKHRLDLFTFLEMPGVAATNWRAEQAIRPAVVNRKVWGGNRTHRGAHAQSILMSLLATCRQHALDSLTWLRHTLCRPLPTAPLPAKR